MTKEEAKIELGSVTYWKGIVTLRRKQLRDAIENIGISGVDYDAVHVCGGEPGSPTENQALRIKDAEDRLIYAQDELKKAIEFTRETIDKRVGDPLQRIVLQLRYVELIDMSQIPEIVTKNNSGEVYSDAHIYRLHSWALNNYCKHQNDKKC